MVIESSEYRILCDNMNIKSRSRRYSYFDFARNLVHRHEPPVTGTPVKILLQDDAREIIVVDKPGSIVSVFKS